MYVGANVGINYDRDSNVSKRFSSFDWRFGCWLCAVLVYDF
jgi:hypothetical protein